MVSWGIPQLCGLDQTLTSGIPEVYSRITEYLGWIDANIEPLRIVNAELGAKVELNCKFEGNRNYAGCQFYDSRGDGPLINIFSRRKRSTEFQHVQG